MTGLEWAAIIGAFAWTPHLLKYGKQIFLKPKITIIPAKFFEVGFSTLGPIFNLGTAFIVKNQDIVVSDLEIHISHESGEKKTFEWQSMRQQISTMTTPDGGIMPNDKQHSVLVIKLNKDQLEERSIQCQEASFIPGKYELETIAIEKSNFLKKQNTYKQSEFIKSQEMDDLYKYIKQSFNWKPGKYTATIELSSTDEFEIENNIYEFVLSSLDIERLEKNKDMIEMVYEELKEDKKNEVKWNWCYPKLKI